MSDDLIEALETRLKDACSLLKKCANLIHEEVKKEDIELFESLLAEIGELVYSIEKHRFGTL
jgi:hypothetical protein